MDSDEISAVRVSRECFGDGKEETPRLVQGFQFCVAAARCRVEQAIHKMAQLRERERPEEIRKDEK